MPQVAESGYRVSPVRYLGNVPHAPGAYRPDAFTDSGKGTMIRWGMHIGNKEHYLPFLERFDYTWRVGESDEFAIADLTDAY